MPLSPVKVFVPGFVTYSTLSQLGEAFLDPAESALPNLLHSP